MTVECVAGGYVGRVTVAKGRAGTLLEEGVLTVPIHWNMDLVSSFYISKEAKEDHFFFLCKEILFLERKER